MIVPDWLVPGLMGGALLSFLVLLFDRVLLCFEIEFHDFSVMMDFSECPNLHMCFDFD